MRTVRNIAAVVVVLTLVIPASAEEADMSRPVKVFILSGQSNMEGVGRSSQLPPELADQPNVKIRSTILTAPDPDEWKTLGGGFGVGKGFGPEVSVGSELAKAMSDADVFLIKSARSGTPLSKRGRVNFHPTEGVAYTTLIRRVQAALKDLEDSGRTYSVEALFWMQGEADALDRNNNPGDPSPTAPQYAKNLRHFITSVRRDLQLPDLPVFAGRLPTNLVSTVFRKNTFQSAHLVIAGQEQVARDAAMNTVLINTDDIPLAGDNLHYNTQGQLALGRRFASAYLSYAAQAVGAVTSTRSKSRRTGRPGNN